MSTDLFGYPHVAHRRPLDDHKPVHTTTVRRMGALTTWELWAHNTATRSDNKIHDDAVARRLGFTGGLVPGVDVYAYLTHLPAEAWGLEWLERGSMRARLGRPVYDGDRVRVVPVDERRDGDARRAEVELRNSEDDACATGTAELPDEGPKAPSPTEWADVEQVRDRPEASPQTLAVGTPFGLDEHGFHADRAGEYLDAVRETDQVYRDERVAHPGWLLRDANYVLSSNVRLGPWIHVESATQHFRLVTDGQTVRTRATVTAEWEHKGHRFVTLDVGIIADDDVAARVTHTAIYRPRQLA